MSDELTSNSFDNEVDPDSPIPQTVYTQIPSPYNSCTIFHFSYNPLSFEKRYFKTKKGNVKQHSHHSFQPNNKEKQFNSNINVVLNNTHDSKKVKSQ